MYNWSVKLVSLNELEFEDFFPSLWKTQVFVYVSSGSAKNFYHKFSIHNDDDITCALQVE